MRTIIVTASSDAFMSLLRDLLKSPHQFADSRPISDIGCLDVGLNEQNRAWISAQGAHIHLVEPAWDLPVDMATRELAPHLRSLTARPFLPEYFPGYDMYIWIDCDAWVQNRYALDWLSHAAKDGALAIVPEADRAYVNHIGSWRASSFCKNRTRTMNRASSILG
jgi:hypothetical protein